MTTYTFIGHGSHKLTTSDGRTIYIDPFFPGDYTAPCDLLLITHLHGDHNAVELVTQKDGCTVITPAQALEGGIYNTFNLDGITVTAVQAYNKNHKAAECVGYVVETDGVKVYFAGDTSTTDDMSGKLAAMNLDYAVLPIDGIYNMDPIEATACAKLLNVRHVIPSHNDPAAVKTGQYSDKGIAEFCHEGKLVLRFGESISLTNKGL